MSEVVNPKRQSEWGLMNLMGEKLIYIFGSLYFMTGSLINMISTLFILEVLNPKRQSEWGLINLMGKSLPLHVLFLVFHDWYFD